MAPRPGSSPRNRNKKRKKLMSWTTPILVEVCIGRSMGISRPSYDRYIPARPPRGTRPIAIVLWVASRDRDPLSLNKSDQIL
jgi:hypothetical protein